MAPAATSRYLNNRQYAMRKPLFSVEQQASILKKTPEDHPEEEKHVSVSRTDDQWNTNMKQLTLESFRFPPRELPPPSASRGELRSPPPSSHISDRLAHEETTVGTPLPGSRAAQQSHSSSTLEVQRLNPPLRPRLTSTVLYPTYTPLPASSILRRRETKQSKDMSSYQSNYWACAIPKSVPPSPDRQAASWDPNREYGALLDYTYPLRPGQVLDEWGSSELQGDSLLQSDLTLQDSGIDLDNFCSSTKLSGLDFCPSSTRQTSERINSCEHQHQLYPTLPDDSSDSDCGLDTGDPNHCKGGGQHHHHHHHRGLTSFIPNAFIRSTSVLPQSRGEGGEIDKEFWPLPDKLEELQFLSRQVREVKAQLSRPVTASSESLETGSASIRSFTTLPEKREDHQETDEEEADAAETAHGGTWKAAGRSHPAWVESAGGGLQRAGLVLDDTQRSNQEAPEQSSSLMHHVQRFQRAVSSQQVRTSRVLHTGQQLLSCINNTSPVLTDTLLLLERQLRVLESHTDLLFPSILSAIDSLTPPSPAE